ncbi:MAG: radical SAM protein [Candidatus Woesearchaeota archaeon]
MRIWISPHCKIVNGYKKSIIIDLEKETFYWINKSLADFLRKLEDNVYIDRIAFSKGSTLKKLYDRNVLTSCEPRGEERRKYTLRRPEPVLHEIWLEITHMCNLDCFYCCNAYDTRKEVLGLEEWKNILIEAFEQGVKKIKITGGEPTMHPHLIELIRFIRERSDADITVITNGTLLDENLLDSFKTYDVSVMITIFSHIAEQHDKLAGKSGSFKTLMKTIPIIQKKGIRLNLGTVMTSANQDDIKGMQNLARGFGIRLNRSMFLPAGKGQDKTLFPDRKNLVKSSYLRPQIMKKNIKYFARNRFFNSCWYGKLTIRYDGEVFPCSFAKYKDLGNILKNTLKDIIVRNALPNAWTISKDNIRICKDCEFRYICFDCRPMADLLNKETGERAHNCTYDPYNGKWD